MGAGGGGAGEEGRGERVLCARELFEGGFGVAQPEVSGLAQGADGFGDAREGVLVRVDVEVANGVVDELRVSSSMNDFGASAAE